MYERGVMMNILGKYQWRKNKARNSEFEKGIEALLAEVLMKKLF